MGRTNRYIPPDGLVEVTNRTIQGRMLLTPSRALNQVVLGVFGRAQRRYEMSIHALVVMSNHFHMLVSPSDGEQLADFMGFINTNLSKEVGRLHGWRGPLWQRRYDTVPVSHEEAAQVERLQYLLLHGCKENLVASPSDWPGVHSVDALVHCKPLKGIWYDRSRAYEARRVNDAVDIEAFGVEETVELTPLPAWREVSLEEHASRVKVLVDSIVKETRSRHRLEGTRPLGVRAILRTNPESKAGVLKRRIKPLCHAASRKVRQEMVERFRSWLLAYRIASAAWRRGNFEVEFPPWSFRPGGGWVRDLGLVPV